MKITTRKNYFKKYAVPAAAALLFLMLCGFMGNSPGILAADIDKNSIRKGPYLIYTGKNTEMKVLWQLYRKSGCQIKWGLNTSYSPGKGSTKEYGRDHQHSYTLKGLKPGTKYYYQVIANRKKYSGSFRTAPSAKSKKLKFMVYGDSRSFPAKHNIVAGGITATYRADKEFQTLIFSTGDMVNLGMKESEWDSSFFVSNQVNIREMLANLPFQACPGNHELYGDKSIDFTLKLFKKYLPYPFVKHAYWSFDYGPAHFVIIDQYYYGGIRMKLNNARITLEMSGKAKKRNEKKARKFEKKNEKKAEKYRKKAKKAAATAEKSKKEVAKLEKQFEKAINEELSWIKKDLASTKKLWKFVLFHEPAWSAAGKHAHENNITNQKYLLPILEKYNVSFAFAGHNHYYARALVNGVHHITTGGGGVYLYHPDKNRPNIIKVSRDYHFCKVTIDGRSLIFEAVKPDGAVIDKFTVKK